ncbi:hypothetical protein PM082_014116 [Marasmius tenuissimus]|nr:hypothetical protein PM082_014116 [Marasmius tenuissimus]
MPYGLSIQNRNLDVYLIPLTRNTSTNSDFLTHLCYIEDHYPNAAGFVEYSNALVELIQSYAQNPHNQPVLKELVRHIYKHRYATLKRHAQSLLAAFPKGDCLVKSYPSEEQWSPLRQKLSTRLANIVRQLHGKEELHSLAFEEPNFLVLREETLASPLLLIYWVVAAIIQYRDTDITYWCLEAVGDYLYECYTDVYLDRTDENISVESPSELDPVVSIFLKGIASFYKYEAARRALVNHPSCKRKAPIKLVFLELELQDLFEPSPEALRPLIESWGLPSVTGKYLPPAEFTVYAPHCTAAAMAACARSGTDIDATRTSRFPLLESLQKFYSEISGLPRSSHQEDWAFTIGTSNECCPTCSLLRGALERTFGIEFNIASTGHSEWSPWWAPGWLPEHILKQMRSFLLKLLHDLFERLDSDDG